MIDFLSDQPYVFGIITALLMWADWLLTVAQERERATHYSAHYQSYPTNTLEGNPALRKGVASRRLVHSKHAVTALLVGLALAFVLRLIPREFRVLFVGYVWGLFLLVCVQHLSNMFGYTASRRGVHGKLYLHQRTAYLVQCGRYASMALLLIILSIMSGSQIIYGVTIAAVISAGRQIVFLRKVPVIGKEDAPPDVVG